MLNEALEIGAQAEEQKKEHRAQQGPGDFHQRRRHKRKLDEKHRIVDPWLSCLIHCCLCSENQRPIHLFRHPLFRSACFFRSVGVSSGVVGFPRPFLPTLYLSPCLPLPYHYLGCCSLRRGSVCYHIFAGTVFTTWQFRALLDRDVGFSEFLLWEGYAFVFSILGRVLSSE